MARGERLPGTPEPTHFFKGADGLRLAADSHGDPSWPLVVLLHGGGQTRHTWKGTANRLAAAGYYTLAYDARGHGDSDWAGNGRYDEDANTADLQALLTQLGSSRPILVGASMGGTTSLVAVGEGHVDARGIVLLDVTPRVEASGIERIRAFMQQNSEGYDSLEKVAEAVARFRPDRPRPADSAGLVKNVRRGSDGKLYWHWDPRVRRDGPPSARTERLNACASRIAVPTLLVRGLHSDVVSEAAAQDFIERCPPARCVTLPGTGHMAPGDANDEFCEAMVAFLQEIDGSRPRVGRDG